MPILSKLKRQYILITGLTVLLFFSLYYSSQRTATPLHIDEYLFVRKSYYFELFFLQQNFLDPRWTRLDEVRQPKIGPYFYGLAFTMSGIKNLEQKLNEIGFYTFNDVYPTKSYGDGKQLFIDLHGKKPGEVASDYTERISLILQARKVAIIFSVAGLFFLLLFLSLYFHPITALIGTLLIGINSLITYYSVVALTDSMQYAAFMSNLFLISLLTKAQQKKPSYYLYGISLAIGIATTLAVGVKTTGIIVWIFDIFIFGVLIVRSKSRIKKQYLISFLLSLVTFILLFTLLHPYLYQNPPLRFIEIFIDRFKAATLIQEPLFGPNIQSPLKALMLIVKRTLMPSGFINFYAGPLPVDALFFTLGLGALIMVCLSQLKKHFLFSGEQLIILWYIVCFGSLCFYLKQDWPRYYIPVLISTTMIETYGISKLFSYVIARSGIRSQKF